MKKNGEDIERGGKRRKEEVRGGKRIEEEVK